MSKAFKHILLAGLMALGAVLPLHALAGDTLQRVIDFQVLKVGMSGNQPPMTMTNREGGLMGFDVDLARALALAMRVKLEIKPMPFGELMTALEKDEIDMVLSNVSITPERTERGFLRRTLHDVRHVHPDQELGFGQDHPRPMSSIAKASNC